MSNKQNKFMLLAHKNGFQILGLLILSLGFHSAHAGGSLVNNGAGIVEQNIMYVYNALPKAIDSCLSLPGVCGVQDAERTVLLSIRQLIVSHPASVERIQFKSEKENPKFFETGLDQAHRLAKTGDQAEDVIYWNTDLLYTAEGAPALDIPALAAIWVHELGHQLKIGNHHYLDQLGATVRFFLNDHVQQIKFYPTSIPYQLTVVDYPSITASTDLYFSDGGQIVSLNKTIFAQAGCPQPEQKLLSWHLWNLHWGNKSRQAEQTTLTFSGKIYNRCLVGSEIQEYEQDFRGQIFLQFSENAWKYLGSKIE